MQISHTFFTDAPGVKDPTLNQYLNDGWKVIHLSTCGNSNRFCFSYILEKENTAKISDTRLKDLSNHIGNVRYGISQLQKNSPRWDNKTADLLVTDFSAFVERVCSDLEIDPK